MVEAADDLEAYRKMPDPESYLEFPGSDVSFQRVFISGTSYIARFFRSGSASQTICRAPRKIVITRDIVGITDVEFHNEFEQCPPHQILGRSYWYKTIQPDAQLFKLHVHSQVQLLSSSTSMANRASTLLQISAWPAMMARLSGMLIGTIP
jgi:hypothetical protein